MPYCSHCGTEVGEKDVFCAKCGGKQPVTPAPASDVFGDISSRNASLLCYIPFVGWIPAIVVLASHRFKQDRAVRFHAFQGLYLFVAWLIVDWAVDPFFNALPGAGIDVHIGSLFKLAVVAVWIYMIVKTSRNEMVSLPLLGELAERSIAEQS